MQPKWIAIEILIVAAVLYGIFGVEREPIGEIFEEKKGSNTSWAVRNSIPIKPGTENPKSDESKNETALSRAHRMMMRDIKKRFEGCKEMHAKLEKSDDISYRVDYLKSDVEKALERLENVDEENWNSAWSHMNDVMNEYSSAVWSAKSNSIDIPDVNPYNP